MPEEQSQRELRPIDLPMVPFAVAGIALWAVAAVVLLVADGPSNWVRICVAGILLGIPGLITMVVHDTNRRRREAAR